MHSLFRIDCVGMFLIIYLFSDNLLKEYYVLCKFMFTPKSFLFVFCYLFRKVLKLLKRETD